MRSLTLQNDRLYDTTAERYAKFRPVYPTALFEYLSALTKESTLCPNKRIALDYACGSGQASLMLADYFDEVVAVDSSREQLEQAKRYRSHPKIKYVLAGAEVAGREIGISANSVKLITVATAYHWLNEAAFLAEAHRLLETGGIFAHWTYTSSVLTVDDPRIKAVVDDFVHEIAPSWPQAHHGSARPPNKLPSPFNELFSEISPPIITMTVSRNLEQFLGYVSTWSAIPRYTEQYGVNPIDDLETRIAPLWGSPKTTYTASQPLYLNVYRKLAPFAT